VLTQKNLQNIKFTKTQIYAYSTLRGHIGTFKIGTDARICVTEQECTQDYGNLVAWSLRIVMVSCQLSTGGGVKFSN